MNNKEFYKNKVGEIPSDWTILPLKEFAWFQEGPGLRKWQFKSEGIKVINVTNLVGDFLDTSNTDRYIEDKEVEAKYMHFLIDENDIVVASSGNSWGKVSVVRKRDLPLLMNTSVIRFKVNDSNRFSRDYLLQFLKSDLFKKQIELLITGSAQPNFGPYHLERTSIMFPTLQEQQKIAEILSAVDEQIDQTNQLIEKVKLLKRGLIQKLLKKGMGNKKLIRTEIGEIPDDWKVVTLGTILNVKYGKSQKSVEVEDSEIPILGTGGIIGWASKPIYDKESVLIGRKGTIDKPQYMNKPFWTIDTLFYTEINCKEAFPKFIFHLFESIDWYRYNEATGVPSLSANNINAIKVALPTLSEQMEISGVLTSVEDNIKEYETMQINLIHLKKSLMQKLLTGKIRVNL